MEKRLGIFFLICTILFVSGCERNRLYDNATGVSIFTFLGLDFGPGGLRVLNVTSLNPDGPYVASNTVEISVQFADVVFVDTLGGTPDLLLATSPTTATALYASGDGTDTLHFEFTVQVGQNSPDLDYRNSDSLRLNGGTITDIAGNAVDRTLPAPGSGIIGMGSLSVNKDLALSPGVAPSVVTSVTSPTTNGRYGPGVVIEIQVIFDQVVTVNTGGGTPRLLLNSGPVAFAEYDSGSGSNSLHFLYTVASGESSSDLDQASTSAFTLNGGTINDSVYGTAADLTLPTPGLGATLAELKAIEIDAVAPGGVTVLNAVPGNGLVTMTWTNPVDPDFGGVRILRREGVVPTGPDDSLATMVCANCSSPTIDDGLANGTSYFFAAYAYDDVANPGPNYSLGMVVLGTPALDGYYIIVGQGGEIRRTQDPAGTWTTPMSCTTQDLNSVVSNGAGELLAAGNNGALCYSDDEGATWQDKSNSFVNTATLFGVTYGNGYWVAVAQAGAIFYSSDIVSNIWGATGAGGSNLNSVTFGNNVFVTVGGGGVIYREVGDPNPLPLSAWGGTNFVPASPGKTFTDVAYGNGEFVAVGSVVSLENEIWYSWDDGITYFRKSFNGIARPYYGVCYGLPGWWVVVGQDFLDYGLSPIQSNVFQSGGAPNGSGTFRDVAYGNGYYVVVGDGGIVMTASDPRSYGNWILNTQSTVNWLGVAYSR
ncbi:MAG: hypothetical protein JW838_07800 [Spirochaetes bacterium]|nr:hypothetical protein [Spirochaetota bacterium]